MIWLKLWILFNMALLSGALVLAWWKLRSEP